MAAATGSGPEAPTGAMMRRTRLASAPSGTLNAPVIGRVDRARAHGVDPQALLGVLDRQRAGEGEHAALRRRVGRGPRVAEQGGGRGDVDDGARGRQPP